MDQFYDEDQMVISQQLNEVMSNQQEIDVDKIYEFDDNEFEELNSLPLQANGFKLNGASKNQIADQFSKDELSDDDSMQSNLSYYSSSSMSSTTKSINSIKSSNSIENLPSYANLNDYVLFDIFSVLSLIELQQMRYVCKRYSKFQF